MKDAEDVVVHIRFIGTVQGVGFRYTAKQYALQHGLKGTVRNVSDGSVELYAAGKRETLDKLIQSLKDHFRHYIQKMDIEYLPTQENYPDFKVIH